uniref:Uncharacterized protein n=1 Tax=Arundo donax TaxID=35708 RepID=A0A0A8Y4Q9_ARUDO
MFLSSLTGLLFHWSCYYICFHLKNVVDTCFLSYISVLGKLLCINI